MFGDVTPEQCSDQLLDSAYNYLLSYKYINFGLALTIKNMIPVAPSKDRVIVIGAGLAWLAAARQLMLFGFEVIVLEGRKRAGNLLGLLAQWLSYTLHKVRDQCPLYRADGKDVDKYLDKKVEAASYVLLDKATKVRQELSQVFSLREGSKTLRKDSGVAMNAEEMSSFNWHLANLEYENASLLSHLSLAYWDKDDPYDMGGYHCFLPGGNGRLVHALAENVPILFEKLFIPFVMVEIV
ncbi:hypothetical protein MTR67_024420 [Solanum verrucosum]|uniref:Uncharacterized protein n=1 Tax=Solanum verrucosum TaxID=315347 RepID=A0AAF0R1L2_SOLVR|nr:hypothetical protein MTR67_024420 [Solanum verrucosum]